MKFHIAPDFTIDFNKIEDVYFTEGTLSFSPVIEWTDEMNERIDEGFNETVPFLEEVCDGCITIEQYHQDFKKIIDEVLGGLPKYYLGQLNQGVEAGVLIEELMGIEVCSPRITKQKWEAIAAIAQAQIK